MSAYRCRFESDRALTLAVAAVRVGDGDAATFVLVEREGEGVLRIEVCEHEPTCHAFQEAMEWCGNIVIGFGDRVHFVSLATRNARTFALDGYFGHLYPHGEWLFVADAERLRLFDAEATLLWTSEQLGIDGVLLSDVSDGTVAGEGEWDPAGGWRPFRVAITRS